MATEVGNIHIGLYVDVGESRRFTDVANVVERSSRRMNTALGGTTAAVRSLRSQMSQSVRFKVASDSLRDITKATDEVGRLRAAILGLSAVSGAGVTGSFAAAYLIQTADKAKLLSNQIRTVTSDYAQFGAVQDSLYGVAQRTRSSLDSTIQLYARAARATEKFGMSQEKLLRLTETIQKSFAVGGATPQEASGAALQLSQGIASDRFGGEEFRSVAENAPVLLDAIASALKTDIGGLRKMSEEGKLTAQVVTDAILKSADKINAKYAQIEPTVAQAFTTVDNAFTRYIGDVDTTYGVTETLAKGLLNLSENFDEIASSIGYAAGMLTAFYAATKTVQGVKNVAGGISSTNRGIREYVDDLVDQRREISAKLLDIDTQKSASQGRWADAEDSALLKQQDALNRSKEKEFQAQQRLNQLQASRNSLVDKLSIAENATITKMQREVELAREQVRLNQQRVIEAQMAAAAEERNAQARREQALQKADARVGKAQSAVNRADLRAAAAKEAIEVRRAMERATIEGQLSKKQTSYNFQSDRLSQTQLGLAELRSIKDLPDFANVYGEEYTKLLAQQQKLLSTTGKLKSEIGGLQGKLAGLADGTSVTAGLTSAMQRYDSALQQVTKATNRLTEAQATRTALGAAAAGTGTSKAETKALGDYERSIKNLQSRMNDLRQATAGAYDTSGTRKLAKEIDNLDGKISAAYRDWRESSAAVASANSSNGDLLRASYEAQARSMKEIADLEQQAVQLRDAHVNVTNKIAAAQRRLNVLMRAGRSVLDYFGGWTGLGITAALTAAAASVAYMGLQAQKGAEKTERLKEELNKMGLLSDEAAGKLDHTSKSIQELTADKQRKRLQEMREEMERLRDQSGWIDSLFGGEDRETLGDLVKELDRVRYVAERGMVKDRSQGPLARELKQIITDAEAGSTSIDDLNRRMDELANKPLSVEMNDLLLKTRQLVAEFVALNKGASEFIGTMSQTTGQQMLERYGNSRTTAASNQQRYESRVTDFAGRVSQESLLTGQEVEVRKIMDRLISDAQKLGQTLLQSDARRLALNELMTEKAKSGLQDLIGVAEGTDKGRGYNETLGYGAFTGGDVNLTMMTLKEVLELQKKMLADPNNTHNSSAVGRYQITSETLRDFMGQLGLSGDSLFSPEVQDRIAQAIIRSTGGDFSKLRGRWTGLENVSDEQLKLAVDASFSDLPRYDENMQKWIDGLKDLDLQAAINKLSEFDRAVVQQAQSMGVSTDEINQYVSAVSSGALDKVPEKFKQIAAAMNLSVSNGFTRQLQELRDSKVEGLLSELDQEVVSTARSFGIGEDAIKRYIAAVRAGDFGNLPSEFSAIREELEKFQNIEFNKELLGTTLDGLRDALEDGKVSWEELGDVALNVLNKIIDKLQGQLVDALFSSTSLFGTGGGSSGGILSGIFSLFGFDEGGWTGPGNKKKPAGVVHADEFVFTKEATRKAGVGNLYSLMDYLETGNIGSLMPSSMLGYEKGGLVGDVSLPSIPSGYGSSGSSGVADLSSSLTSSETSSGPSSIDINVAGARGNAEIMDMVRQGVEAGIKAYNKKLPYRIKEINGNGGKIG